MVFMIAAQLAGAATGGERERRVTNATKWLCYYGGDRGVLDAPGYQMLILERDAIGVLTPDDKQGKKCIAYMSVGEVNTGRWYWPGIEDSEWVLEANPEWPDARLVDVRSPEWRELLVDVVAASLIEAGYDGFMLDNVDTAEVLLRRDSERYQGADDAMIGIVRELRERYPDAVIIANGGLSIVPQVADSLDAMMYEGTVSTWRRLDDGELCYHDITPQQRAWLRPRLLRVKNAGLQILALEYVAPSDRAARKKVWNTVVRMGNNPFVSVRGLDLLPESVGLKPGE